MENLFVGKDEGRHWCAYHLDEMKWSESGDMGLPNFLREVAHCLNAPVEEGDKAPEAHIEMLPELL